VKLGERQVIAAEFQGSQSQRTAKYSDDMVNPLDVPPYLLQSLIPSITAGNVTCAQAFGA
jgi:hypothetical protein